MEGSYKNAGISAEAKAKMTRWLKNAPCIVFPAADVRPVVRGKWIDRDDDYYGWNVWACSACGEEFVLAEGTPDMNNYHYCPNCGADMRGEQDV
jgi:rubredoxin